MAVTIIDPFDPQMPFPIDLRNRKLNSAQRDMIPANARYEGLMCYVQDEQNKRWCGQCRLDRAWRRRSG